MSEREKKYREVYALTSGELMDFKLKVARVKPSDLVVDLGCGDAEVLIKAYQQYGSKGVGLELRPEALELSNCKVKSAGVNEHIQILDQDFMSFDYMIGDVYILYLNRSVLGQLSLKLENELKSGSRIVTHDFDLPAWKHKEHHIFKDLRDQSHDVFLYEK